MTEITAEGVHAQRGSPRARKRILPPGAIGLATLIALATVGWEHLYHTAAHDLDASAAGHLIHVLRDTALVWPLALLATIVGLRFTRPLARAAGMSVVMGLLLVPSAEIHGRIDGALSGAHDHHEVGSGLRGMLEHGVHDALLAQAVTVPLAILGFTQHASL